ncbi:16055_t:CDS:2 [Funneliformis caledonium]|uniref:16055_t:CDS:1 n=1 Tax=Funneliformis caledonium TaxID=1117310 RepID=A0A9N9A5M1_9GLOM|nr:16055_t:CDS:2 [Funneliformis caledonium]
MDFLKNLKNHLDTNGTSDKPVITYSTTIITKRLENGVPVEVITKTYESNSPIEVKLPEGKIEVVKPPDANKRPDEVDPDEPEMDDSTVGHKDHDFSKVDAYARETPKAEAENAARLSKYLTKPWNNELDKLRCIFTWIADNVKYDTDAYFGGNIQQCGPEDVLKTRKAVCDGYAELFDKLASNAGLKVWKISGQAKGKYIDIYFKTGDLFFDNNVRLFDYLLKGAGYTPGCDIDSRQFAHSWNGVLYKGEFLLVDNTWGAGILNGTEFEKHFEPFHFLCSPTQFIYSHFPEKPEQQYVEPKLTKAEFLDLPYVKPKFFSSGLGFVKHLGNEIKVSDDKVTMEIERIHPDESKPLHATLEWKGQELTALIQRLATPGPKGGRKYKLSCTCPSKGEGKFNIFVMLKGNEGPLVSSFIVKNSGSGKHFTPYVDTYSVPFSFTIQNPIHAKLPYNEHVKFEITIFDLSESELPSFALFLPDKTTKDLPKVSSTSDSCTFALDTCVDKKGKWNLTYCSQPNTFNFIAQYNAE